MRLRPRLPPQNSGVWNLLSVALLRIAGFVTLAIVARLSGPSDIGVVAIASVAFGVLTMFNDLGVGGVLMTHPDFTASQRRVCLTLILAWALALAGIGCAASWLVAAIFHDSRVTGVLLVLCASMLPLGLTWFTDPLLLARSMSRTRFIVRAAQSAAVVVVGCLFALKHFGAYALALSQLAGALAACAVSAAVLRRELGIAWDGRFVKRVLGLSRGFLAQGGLAFVAQNADNALVGRNLGAAALGIYATTYRLAEVPYASVAEPLSQVAIPRYVSASSTAARGRAYVETLRGITALAFAGVTLLIGGGAFLLPLLLGASWAGHGGVVTVLGVWGLVRVVQATQAWYANAVGGAGYAARVTGALLLIKLPALYLASTRGLVWVAIVMTSAAVVQLLVVSRFTRARGATLRATVHAAAPAAVAAFVAGALLRALGSSRANFPLRMGEILLCLLIYVCTLVLLVGSYRRSVVTAARAVFEAARSPRSVQSG